MDRIKQWPCQSGEKEILIRGMAHGDDRRRELAGKYPAENG
ncbi:hypothetical protein PYR66_16690 [Klebsiella aerogenes]|nr:hypothetical protein PYR66_16690 [Klebsiella aerogenes]